MKLKLFSIALFVFSFKMSAQNTVESNFEKYPVKLVSAKKATIKSSNKYQPKYPKDYYYQPNIKQMYKDADINFAGQYIIIEHGRTNYETSAFMVDTKTGKIYDLPDGENGYGPESISRCTGYSEISALMYKPHSNLLITNQYYENVEHPITKRYLWNNETKKFSLLDSKPLKCVESD